MANFHDHKVMTALLFCLLAFALFVAFEILFIVFNGTPVPAPDIPRDKQTIGTGEPLTYAILGDSTSISQGGSYENGYAVATAEFLAQDHQVTYQNFGVSGARTADVANSQASEAARLKPGVALIAIGANDVTHVTSEKSVESDFRKAIATLREANPSMKIVITGSPEMGAVPRFPQPIRYFAGQKTESINKLFVKLADELDLTFAPIAEKTGPAFRENPKLFAADKFHPNDDGYALWIPVLQEALK
jgi:lysophospholipase L1-like esterase